MTVAAVILASTADGALTDTLGQPRVRRLVDIAWAGGALPVVVVAPDPDGAVARLYGVKRRFGPTSVKRATFVIGTDGIVLHALANELQMTVHADQALDALRD